eukprot:scaffold472903_cov39-Attheya_sp.AAC.1
MMVRGAIQIAKSTFPRWGVLATDTQMKSAGWHMSLPLEPRIVSYLFLFKAVGEENQKSFHPPAFAT